jgi:hypothetical protein
MDTRGSKLFRFARRSAGVADSLSFSDRDLDSRSSSRVEDAVGFLSVS